ncbi:MAG: hypothetical protein LBI15_06740 [Dysgonamonadaceae bacterium]|jgi:hypothetical protein|nr:hypothetical protein [Dysgonamonadaceae bacterium]
MKSKLFLAAIAVAMMFASCNNEEVPVIDPGKGALAVKIVTPGTANRATQAPTTGAVYADVDPAGNHRIFFVDAGDNVIRSIALDPTQAIDGEGQVISDVVASWRVYVVLNAPTSVNTLTTLTAIKAAGGAVTGLTSLEANGFVPMSNHTDAASMVPNTGGTAGTPAGDADYQAVIEVSPAISRLEVTQISTGVFYNTATLVYTRIVSFDVNGVYVDGYSPNYTFAGAGSGTLAEMDQTFANTGLGDNGPWSSNATPAVTPTPAGTVWAYNLAAGAAPRLIIPVTNVVTQTSLDNAAWSASSAPDTSVRYLTVTWATNAAGTNALSTFSRANVYQVANIMFSADKLHSTPNPIIADTRVEVTVRQWTLNPTWAVVQ